MPKLKTPIIHARFRCEYEFTRFPGVPNVRDIEIPLVGASPQDALQSELNRKCGMKTKLLKFESINS